ncbi:MAG: hypothetical protein AAF587_33860 [Bacteroidota bacterium]
MKSSIYVSLLAILCLSISCVSQGNKHTSSEQEPLSSEMIMSPQATQAELAFQKSLDRLQSISMEVHHQDRTTHEENMALYARISEAEHDCFLMYNAYLRLMRLDTLTETQFWNSFASPGTHDTSWDVEAYTPIAPDSALASTPYR